MIRGSFKYMWAQGKSDLSGSGIICVLPYTEGSFIYIGYEEKVVA